MKTKHVLHLASVLSLLATAPVTGQRVGQRVSFSGIFDGQLLTDGEIRATAPDDVVALEFVFTPDSRLAQPVTIGRDIGKMEPSYGPECDPEPCLARVFSVPTRNMRTLREGWGYLTARSVGGGEEATARVYWDSTPPEAPFLAPRFNASVDLDKGVQVVAHTQDEDIISLKVFWVPATAGNRNIPPFEQHQLGGDFAGHAACVPTTVGANLKWLQTTSQWTTWLDFFTDDFTVNSLGFFMGTTTSGTGGGAAVNGTVDYLNFWFGYQNGVDYNLLHPGMNEADGKYGFTPQQMLEQFQAGGAVSLGIHNMPHIDGNLFDDPPFGHFIALDNVVLNPNGTAWLRVMDPHLQPPAVVGTYRWLLLNTNGTIEWDAANTGYYTSSYSGLVRLDELHIIRDYFFFASLGLRSSGLQADNSAAIGGEVSGALTNGGHTFVGKFTPPEGSAGPWLLISESTHAAGHTQRAYRYVGAQFGTRPPE